MEIKFRCREILAGSISHLIKNSFYYSYRLATSPKRMTPEFIIPGAPKCGTTSLYNYLIQHPQILSASRKEPMFFSMYYNKNPNWYKINFPFSSQLNNSKNKKIITGEASTSYLIYPNVPEKIKKMFPHVKIIIMLRNPVDRAFSQYKNQVRNGREKLSFEMAIKEEVSRLGKSFEEIKNSKPKTGLKYVKELFQFNPSKLLTYSYLTGGHYFEQIINWTKVFPLEQIKIINSEQFFEESDVVFNEVIDFLGLEKFHLNEYKKFNVGNDSNIEDNTRQYLIDYFKPHNEKLFKFLNLKFDWNR